MLKRVIRFSEVFMPRISFEEIAKQNVARLLDYAQNKLYLNDLDAIYAQNQLLDALGLTQPCDEPKLGTYDIYEVMNALSGFAVRKKLSTKTQNPILKRNLWGLLCHPLQPLSICLTTKQVTTAWTKRAIFFANSDSTACI